MQRSPPSGRAASAGLRAGTGSLRKRGYHFVCDCYGPVCGSSRSSVPGADQHSALSRARSALVAPTVTGVNVRPGEAVTACFPGSRRLWGPAAVWVRSAEHILGRCSRGWRRTALKGTSWELLPLQAPGGRCVRYGPAVWWPFPEGHQWPKGLRMQFGYLRACALNLEGGGWDTGKREFFNTSSAGTRRPPP